MESNLLKHPQDINKLQKAIYICIISAISIILYGLDVSEGLIRNQLQINSTNKLPKCLRCQISSLDNLDGKETWKRYSSCRRVTTQ